MKNSIDTMTYWPAKIKNPDEIPSDISTDEAAAGNNYSILFPSLPFQIIREKKKLLTLSSKGIEYAEQGLSHFLDFNEIPSIEWTSSLLKGIIRIYHLKRTYTINFNSCRNDYIVPFIESFREKKAVSKIEHEKPFYHCGELEFLIKQNLKLFNIAGDTISSNDIIEEFFYQHPFSLSGKQLSMFARFYTPYLILGLENEWIIIKEDKQKTAKTGTYGWTKQYIHKDMVEDISIRTETAPDYIVFTLKGNYDFRLPVSRDLIPRAELLIK